MHTVLGQSLKATPFALSQKWAVVTPFHRPLMRSLLGPCKPCMWIG